MTSPPSARLGFSSKQYKNVLFQLLFTTTPNYILRSYMAWRNQLTNLHVSKGIAWVFLLCYQVNPVDINYYFITRVFNSARFSISLRLLQSPDKLAVAPIATWLTQMVVASLITIPRSIHEQCSSNPLV